MPKNILHDVMTKERRSIRHVPLPSGRKGREDVEEDILYSREEYQADVTAASPPLRRGLLWFGTFLFVLFLGVAVSAGFSGATITVTPKAELVAIDHEFTASRSDAKKLRFDTLSLAETAERTLPADTTKKVTEKATGTIIIYNNFSTKPQRLIKNTRFETQNGLVYRIGSSVTVPGKTVASGKATPGSIEAVVAADSPGEEYNIPLSDFTVPGFKTDAARFAGFYARSKTSMAGGFDGVVKAPSEAKLAAARAELRASLAETLLQKAEQAVPKGSILFRGATPVAYESLLPEGRNGGLTAVKERGTGESYLFKKADIVQAIAKATLPAADALPVEIPELKSLVFTLKEPSAAGAARVDAIRFRLKGSVRMAWLYDAGKLKSALVGKSRDALTQALSSFPTIEKVDVVFRPFWSRSFPDNPKKLFIISDVERES